MFKGSVGSKAQVDLKSMKRGSTRTRWEARCQPTEIPKQWDSGFSKFYCIYSSRMLKQLIFVHERDETFFQINIRKIKLWGIRVELLS